MRFTHVARSSWDIMASVIIHRPPIVAPQMTAIEKRYAAVQSQIEKENSLLNDYEIKSKKDQILLERKAKLEAAGRDLSELEGELEVTNQMREQEWQNKATQLAKRYKFDDAEKIEGDVDEKNEKRLADKELVLVVKQRYGREDGYQSPWQFPEISTRQGEPLRQSAERCVGELLMGDVSIQGNAPISVFTLRYPKPIADAKKKSGSKVFFYNAILGAKTAIKLNTTEFPEYAWVSAEEFVKRVPGTNYRSAVRTSFLQ
ncbi:unnamed protein product, partial [Mesorhabditis spiculigera]